MILLEKFQKSKAALLVTQEEQRAILVPYKKESKYKQITYSARFALTHVVLPPLSDAYDTAKMLCEKYYLAAPELKIEEFNSKIIVSIHVFECFQI